MIRSISGCVIRVAEWIALVAMHLFRKAVEDAAEETEDAAGIERGEIEATEQDTEIVAVGLMHGRGRVAGGEHGFFDEACEAVESCGVNGR